MLRATAASTGISATTSVPSTSITSAAVRGRPGSVSRMMPSARQAAARAVLRLR